MPEIRVGNKSEFQEGTRKLVEIGDEVIGVFYYEGKFHAYRNDCVHRGGPICEGVIVPKVAAVLDNSQRFLGHDYSDHMHIVCPWHGWEFNLETGEFAGDRALKLKKYEVIEDDKGDLFVIK